MKAFNQEKALVGAFSVIVQLHRLIVYSTNIKSGVCQTDEVGEVRAEAARHQRHLRGGRLLAADGR